MFTFLWRAFQDRRLVGRFRRPCAGIGDAGQLAFEAGRSLGRWSLPGQHRIHGDVSPGNLFIGWSGNTGWPGGDGALVGGTVRIFPLTPRFIRCTSSPILKATRRTLFANRELSPTIGVSSVAVASGRVCRASKEALHLFPAESS
jgi:hypothetical protein